MSNAVTIPPIFSVEPSRSDDEIPKSQQNEDNCPRGPLTLRERILKGMQREMEDPLRLPPASSAAAASIATVPAFRTERMNVFRFDNIVTQYHAPRAIFLGFLNYDAEPYPVVTAVVWINSPVRERHYLNWIQTSDRERRQGLAKELWLGLEKYLGSSVYAHAASVGGEALLAAIERTPGRIPVDLGNKELREEVR